MRLILDLPRACRAALCPWPVRTRAAVLLNSQTVAAQLELSEHPIVLRPVHMGALFCNDICNTHTHTHGFCMSLSAQIQNNKYKANETIK